MKKYFMQHSNDCYTACIATLLQVPYELVPRFMNDNNETVDLDGNLEPDWHTVVMKFFNKAGLGLLYLNTNEQHIKTMPGYIIVTGLSYTPGMREKGIYHSVIYKDGELWHDPKPNPTGVIVPEIIDFVYPLTLIGIAKI